MPYGDFKDLALVWRRFCDEKSQNFCAVDICS